MKSTLELNMTLKIPIKLTFMCDSGTKLDFFSSCCEYPAKIAKLRRKLVLKWAVRLYGQSASNENSSATTKHGAKIAHCVLM